VRFLLCRRRALGGALGFSLMEVLIASFISAIFLSAAGSLYLTSRRAFDYGTSQAYVQRQGTMIQEQIARWAKSSVTVQRVLCGGNTTAGRSLAIQDANGTIRCVYQSPETDDTDADLFVCQVASWNAACTGGTNYNMLNVMPSEVSVGLGAPLRVRNTTFMSVTCIDPGPCTSGGTIALSVTSNLVAVRFDLTDNTIPNPQQGTYVGMRFGFGITSRN
jgi:prepilin-type N-terminal cleavage/methylation domain-containing protein